MEFLIEYGMFLARVATILIAIIIVVSVIASSGQKQKKIGKDGLIKVTRLNDHINDLREALRLSILDKDDLKALHKEEKKTYPSSCTQLEGCPPPADVRIFRISHS